MSTATAGLAEAYLMRKLHKEKMKKLDNRSNELQPSQAQEAAGSLYNREEAAESNSDMASRGGCFSWLTFKKIHPNTV